MSIFWVIAISLIATGFGWRLLDCFKIDFEDEREKSIVSLCLGFGLISYAVVAIGLLRLLYSHAIFALLLVLAIFSFRNIIGIIKSIFASLKNITLADIPPFYRILLSFLVLVLMFTFVGALAPVTGHDSQAYRLTQIRIFVKQHAVTYLPFTRESLWPYLIEMLFASGMSISSDITAKLIAWSFGVILIALSYVFTSRHYSKKAGILTAVIFSMTPAVFMQMAFAYVDLAFAVYSIIFLILCLKYLSTLKNSWAVLAGVFGGFTLSIKYVGIITVFAAAITIICYAFIQRLPWKAVLRGLVITAICAFIFSFSWYLRAYLIKGNPLYPLAGSFFNNHGWEKGTSELLGTGLSLNSFIQLPLVLLLDYRFGGENFGPAYLLFLPFAFLINKNKNIFSYLGIFTVIYILLWFFSMAVTNRFLFPVLLILSMLIGCGLDSRLKEKGQFPLFIKILLLGFCIFGLSLALYHNLPRVKVAFGLESKHQYLLKQERSYKAENFIKDNLPPDAVIFMIGELRAYYMDRKYIHFEGFMNEHKLNSQTLQPGELLSMLKQQNIKYILYCIQESAPPEFSLEGIPELGLLFSCIHIDKDKKIYNYKVFKI